MKRNEFEEMRSAPSFASYRGDLHTDRGGKKKAAAGQQQQQRCRTARLPRYLSPPMARLTLLAAGLLLLCFEPGRAAPMQYRKYLGKGAREARRRVLAAPAGADPADHCGDPGNNQTMWFAERQLCSLASANFTYMYHFAGAMAPVPLVAKESAAAGATVPR
jgi:hypothetical protein